MTSPPIQAERARPRDFWLACGVFGLALLVRLIVLAQISHEPSANQLIGDGRAYWNRGTKIVEHGWLGDEVFYQAPLYPYFLAVMKTLGLSIGGVRFLQAAIGSLSCALVALAARRLFSGNPVAWTAGVMMAIYPAVISFDLQIDKPVLDVLFTSALLLSVATLLDDKSYRRWAICGAIGGLLALTRENALALLIVLATWGWLRDRHIVPSRDRLIRAGALIAGAAVVLLPVAIRNSLIGREFHLATAQLGPNFYIGNNISADGTYQPLRVGRGDAAFERTDATELAQEGVGRKPLSPGEVSRYWTRRALSDIAADPLRWLRLLAAKSVMVFSDTELADSNVHDRFVAFSPVLRMLDWLWGFRVLCMLTAASALLVTERRRIAIVWIMIATTSLATALFYVFARYRLLLAPMMIPLAAAAIVRIFALLRERRFALLLPAAGLGLLAAIIVQLGERAIPVRLRGTNHYNRAQVFSELGDLRHAESLYRRAIAENPKLAAACNNLGLLLADTHRLDEAESLIKNSIALEPNDASAHINLGLVFGRRRDLDRAADEFRTALAIDPTSTAARYNLAQALALNGQRDAAAGLLRTFASPSSPDPFARRAFEMLQSVTFPAPPAPAPSQQQPPPPTPSQP